jgi:pyruvate/2-oxoglutarate dehydrogenase complex dihydrolipoamide acyltransferase (E2) component
MHEQSVLAPFSGTVVSIPHDPAARVSAGAPLVVLEAMKMEHEVLTETAGVLRRVEVSVGEAVQEGQLLAVVAVEDGATPGKAAETEPEPEPAESAETRADLRSVRERHALGLDAARPDAVAKRQAGGPPGRTCPTWSTREPSSSTAR